MPIQLDAKILSMAVAQTLQMWVHKEYERFLQTATPGPLTSEWFNRFLGHWNVARTIRKRSQSSVRHYLDVDFRRAVLGGGASTVVDEAASHIQRSGWSTRRCRPLSLVSKIGFFFRPAEFVPKDTFGLEGLNRILRPNGNPTLKNPNYSDYLQAFNGLYGEVGRQVGDAMEENWVAAFAAKLGCPNGALETPGMRRKVFDNYLMRRGDYLPSW